ncbi:hypothetical protein I5677_07025 [Mobilitalea sibirica]|uniref:Uncharacterized protein n=1 Tax=Mobilitalea sibirica TaxID=1462919 RepID=A0A8J7H202_9FIRM|nr:hypothetical protein [Mobilitalea sibirica]MBH1940637.1 hypothetical protein [Mobilitalea sibirica]
MKINHITEAVKILIFAATVFITCILVTLGFQAAETAKEISGSAISSMAEINSDLKDSDIKKYDKTEVYGSDVVNFIKKYLGDYSVTETAPVYVLVKTSLAENTYTNGVYISDIRNFSNAMYIKPTAVFTGEVIKNANDVIVGINFIQI